MAFIAPQVLEPTQALLRHLKEEGKNYVFVDALHDPSSTGSFTIWLKDLALQVN